MEYKIYRDGKLYLEAEEIETLKEILFELAKQNQDVSYCVRKNGVKVTEPATFWIKRTNKIEQRDKLYFKLDVIKISECDFKKILVQEIVLGEEEFKIVEETFIDN